MEKKGRKPIFYGWWIVLVAFYAYLVSIGPISYGTSILSLHIVKEQGWSEGIIGTGLSVHYLAIALLSVPGGMLIEKKGFRFTLILGALCGIAGYLWMAFAPVSRAGYLGTFFLVGINAVLCALLGGPGLVNGWFDRRKSLPMSLVLTAGAAGGFLLPGISRRLTQIGDRVCWLVYAGMLGVLIVLTLAVVRESPEQVGELRDGRDWRMKRGEKTGEEKTTCSPSLKRCYRSGALYIQAIQAFLSKLICGGFVSYVVIYAVRRNLPEAQAVMILTVFNVAGLISRLLSGEKDEIPIPENLLQAASFLLLACGAGILFLANKPLTFWLGAAVMGGSYGITCILQVLMLPDYFGDRNFQNLNGVLNMVAFAGNAAGPLVVFGIARAFGGYQYAFLALALISLLCGVLAVYDRVRLLRD